MIFIVVIENMSDNDRFSWIMTVFHLNCGDRN